LHSPPQVSVALSKKNWKFYRFLIEDPLISRNIESSLL
jgi:hypothetical protein